MRGPFDCDALFARRFCLDEGKGWVGLGSVPCEGLAQERGEGKERQIPEMCEAGCGRMGERAPRAEVDTIGTMRGKRRF